MQITLPTEYERKKKHLKEILDGGDYAWQKDVILEFLKGPNTAKLAILGGDVIIFENGRPPAENRPIVVADGSESVARKCLRRGAKAPRSRSGIHSTFAWRCNRCREANGGG